MQLDSKNVLRLVCMCFALVLSVWIGYMFQRWEQGLERHTWKTIDLWCLTVGSVAFVLWLRAQTKGQRD